MAFHDGFDFFERDRATLEYCSHWGVKRSDDELYELLAPSEGFREYGQPHLSNGTCN